MTGCRCKILTHAHHAGRPCENIGSESDGLCPACHELVTKADTGSLLDAFADLRRTWDELIGLQPDIVAASGSLSAADLRLLYERLMAHRNAATALAREVRMLRELFA